MHIKLAGTYIQLYVNYTSENGQKLTINKRNLLKILNIQYKQYSPFNNVYLLKF